jgi:mannose-1-phosphate guanylyltransferase
MPRKAMLLAAGLGTRLHPLTDSVSKCMIPIAGKPLLEHNVGVLRSYGVTDLVINLHHLPETVMNHFGDGSGFGVRITYSHEPELLGTAGAVKKVERFFDGPFFIWYGDNLSTCRLDRLWQFHQSRRGVATIALHHREDPTRSGIVGLDLDDRITRFLEKPRPDQIFSNWVSAGILVLEREVLKAIPAESVVDFGRDVFPALTQQDCAVFGYRMSEDESLWWIDTTEDLARVEQSLAGCSKGR